MRRILWSWHGPGESYDVEVQVLDDGTVRIDAPCIAGMGCTEMTTTAMDAMCDAWNAQRIRAVPDRNN